MKRRWIAIIKAILTGGLLAACATIPPPKPLDGKATCADACIRAREMRCDFAEATPEGQSCEAVCQGTQDSGIFTLDLECRAKATSCEAAEACEVDQ